MTKYKTGKTITSMVVVNSQQELARSISRSYREGGIKAMKATGMDERMMITFRSKPSPIFW
jgi:hypothetical protein